LVEQNIPVTTARNIPRVEVVLPTLKIGRLHSC